MKTERTGIQPKDVIGLLLLLLLIVWFGRDLIWMGKVPFFRDLGTYFYPMRLSLAESLGAWELPLWDRHMAMGFPLLADFQSGSFYPLHLIFLFLPFFEAIRAAFILHYVVAAAGTYVLCRYWNFPRFLSLLGAVLFTLGGTMISLTNLLNHFQTAVWLPWVLFFWERVLRGISIRNGLGLVAASLAQFLAGSPELYVMSMGLVALDGLRLALGQAGVSLKRVVSLFLGTNLLIAGLGAAQILPTVELVLQSRGRQPISYTEATTWSLHPLSLINLIFLDKYLDLDNLTSPRLFFLGQTPFFISYYLGAIFPVGFLLWLCHASSKEKISLSLVILASILLALGATTPIYSLLFNHVPVFNLFRFPEKFFFITYAVLILVVLRGLLCFLQSEHSATLALSILFSFIISFLVLYVFLRLETEPLIHFITWATQNRGTDAAISSKASSAVVHLERHMALTLGILLLLVMKKKRKLDEPLFATLIVALVFIDLSSAHRQYQFPSRPNFVYGNSRIIQSPDSFRNRLFYYPSSSGLHPSSYKFAQEPSFAKFNSAVFDNLLPNTGLFHGFDYMQELDALGRWPYTAFLRFANKVVPEKQVRLLGSLNVKYISSFTPLPEKGLTLLRHFSDPPSWLYAIDEVIPRVYIVAETEAEKDPLKILDRLSSVDFNPKKTVILEQPLSLPPTNNMEGRAKIARYENKTVLIRALMNEPGILILADSFYPGWKAYVNGKEENILRANLFFRAVALPAGEHRVEFRYEPFSFKIGLRLSVLTLTGLLIFALGLYARRRRRAHLAGS